MIAPLLLTRGLQLLTTRVMDLEKRVGAGDETAWPEYVAALHALAALDRPQRGAMLTTAEMAERLGVQPKSLLRRVASGDIRPAMQAGKLIRWRGDETVAASPGQGRGQRLHTVAGAVAMRVATGPPNRPRKGA